MMAQDQLWVLLHERFRELEETNGLTQAALARKVGCDRQSVNRWLSGPSNISIFSAAKLFAGMDSDLRVACKPWRELGTSNYYRCFDEPKLAATKAVLQFRNTGASEMRSGSLPIAKIVPAIAVGE